MPKDVLTAALGYHLRQERKRETSGLATLTLCRLMTTDWYDRMPKRVMTLPATGRTGGNGRLRHEAETTLFSHVASDGFVSKLSKYLNLWEDLAQGSAYHQTISCHCWFQVAISRQEANYRK